MTKQVRRIRRGLKAKKIQRIASSSRPRLVVFRSNEHIYAQIMKTGEHGDIVLVSSSTIEKELSNDSANKVDQAISVGKRLGERAVANDIAHVAFDRNGFKYHGRIKALADAAREAGLIF